MWCDVTVISKLPYAQESLLFRLWHCSPSSNSNSSSQSQHKQRASKVRPDFQGATDRVSSILGDEEKKK
jgi:hypothetical protein